MLPDDVAPDAAPLLWERRGPVVVLTLNRPAVLNALNGALWSALAEAAARLAEDADCRAIVLTGAGPSAFSAGADMREGAAASLDEARARSALIGLVSERLLALPQPVLAAINGYAYGGGAILSLHCDLRIAAASARFRFPGVAYGIVAATALLPRIVGLPNALDLALTARSVAADEALTLGLVNRVVADGEALAATLVVADQIASHESRAVAATKRLLRLSLTGDLDTARRREWASNQDFIGSDQHRRVFGDFVRDTLDRPRDR